VRPPENRHICVSPKIFKCHTTVSLDDLVPQDNFYRQIEAKLDLSFVREFVKDGYASHMGRPSIDPVTFFKLHLIMFFEGIRSERQPFHRMA
jgi:transposase